MNWTDERVELLKKLWAEGLSASQIATQLGGVSRNAVIGKVHRLKLSGRGRNSASTPRPKKTATNTGPRPAARTQRPVTTTVGATALQARFDAEPDVQARARPQDNVVIPIPLKLKLVELGERTCKWPIGDPMHDDFAFCGVDVGECGPYCSYHSRLAYQPANERRKAR
ncbi:GcrA cell cycle regulator [Chelativorans sp. ZYF759]|uniref:GcrA family cell cycle regulator n=1 Tax=Chelativorans sp. ZYF759 TaxID=2692213 RepID=UPI00145ED7B5|nr:GcrA family cell cycle regulator [Chelativorans sp. ZYF759]NMG41720.1 GcrA cell cycle regulator [Chelativorans sp. ZYF759]